MFGDTDTRGRTRQRHERLRSCDRRIESHILGMHQRVKVMTDTDVIQVLGQPDEIVSTGMTAKEWTCATCLKIIHSEKPIPMPAPCPRCGGIVFEKVR